MDCFTPDIKCTYVPPVVNFILVRKKKGQIQVRINGKGKWINAEYNEERKTINFTA